MTTFLFLTWFTAAGYVKTDVIPMPNMEVCKKIELRMKNPPTVDIKGPAGINLSIESVPKDARCEEF